MDPNYHLRNELLFDVEKMCQKLNKSPAAILISGDIAYRAHADEYVFALGWLEMLADRCGTNIKDVFIVPGNHDVNQETAA
ncbi:MAG: metallophosphoesterase, partial [Desulforhopalus sp.]